MHHANSCVAFQSIQVNSPSGKSMSVSIQPVLSSTMCWIWFFSAFNRLQDITVSSCPSAISSWYIECALGFHCVWHASFQCPCIQLLFRCLVAPQDDCTARRGIIVFCLNKHSWLHCKIKSHFEQEVDERISVRWALAVDGKARLVTTEVFFFSFFVVVVCVSLLVWLIGVAACSSV